VILDKYIEEFKSDTIINEINLKEKSLMLPGLKAKWVSRLITHKNNLNKLQKNKKKIIKEAIPAVRESLPVKLSDSYIKEHVEEINTVSEFSKKIQDEEVIIDYLEKVEKIMSSMTYDLGNIVKIVQLETL
jgi:hypothetical protein